MSTSIIQYIIQSTVNKYIKTQPIFKLSIINLQNNITNNTLLKL